MPPRRVVASPGSPPSDEELRGRVALGTVASVAAQVVSFGSWFFLTPLMVHRLGGSAYGLWAVASAIAGYALLLDFGIRSTVVKHVAELRAQGEVERLRTYIATAFWLLAGLGCVVLVIVLLLASLSGTFFHFPSGMEDEAPWVIALVGANAALTLVGGVTYDVLGGLQRYGLLSLIGTVGTLVTAGAYVGVLLTGGGVVELALVSILLTVLMQVPAVATLLFVAPELRLCFKGDLRLLRQMFTFSLGVFVLGAAGAIQTRTDEVVIGAALPVRNVTSYTLARRVSEAPNLIAAQLSRVLLPVASELGARKEDERLRNVLVTATRVTLAGFLPVACALAVFAEPFLTAWVGSRYAGDADVLIILLAAGAVDVALWPAGYILVGVGRHRMLAVFALSSALVNLGLSIALVGPLGTKGVALATLTATTAEASLLVVPYVLRLTGLQPLRALTQMLLPAVLPLVPEALLLYAVDRVLAPSTLPEILLAGAAGGAVYALVFLRLHQCTAERAIVAQVARRGAFMLARTAGGGAR